MSVTKSLVRFRLSLTFVSVCVCINILYLYFALLYLSRHLPLHMHLHQVFHVPLLRVRAPRSVANRVIHLHLPYSFLMDQNMKWKLTWTLELCTISYIILRNGRDICLKIWTREVRNCSKAKFPPPKSR
jgi:hypothetical protein